MISLVFSYSHADEALRNELAKHLSFLKRMGKISTWHDRCIIPGQEFEPQIGQYFAEADIILLLISSDFIASDYCYNVEMRNALERHDAKDAVVIPVILRECAWHQLPFGNILAATVDGKPVSKFPSLDEGFVQVADAVSRAIEHINTQKAHKSGAATSSGSPQSALPPTGTVFTPRSSNLSLPRVFTDYDKDLACREGFEYIARYFENTLLELKKRHTHLNVDFHQRDADSFTCAIYMDGTRVGHCGIWRGNNNLGIGDICYSQNGVTHNSCNESLNIADNGQSLGFRALMGFALTHARDTLLTNEGMAEYLWEMFFTPIQQRTR
jgi:hypothetical protein